MTPPIPIGSEVLITGPTITGCDCFVGEKFTVSYECHDAYTGGGFPWYPASSLRVVEELKIGDFVEIVGKSVAGYDDIGTIGKIGGNNSIHSEYQVGMGIYPPRSLRKLTPDEIAKHTGTIDARMVYHDGLLEGMDKRLSAIEKRQSAICRYNIETEQRLQVLEGERPEVIDREQFCVPDNAFFSVRSGENGKVVIEYSESGFELAKAVLDSMREGRGDGVS